MTPDWRAWHAPYADPTSTLSRRLAVVQESLASALDRAPDGPLRLVSACAGQGHDAIGVLSGHPRADDVSAVLVEYDADNAAAARAAASAAGLDRVHVVTGDAGLSDAYAGAVPADMLLMCGVFGNVPDADVERTVRALPSLCAPGATVIWTRHRGAPDLTPAIRGWFAESGFAEQAFVAPDDVLFSVGTHVLTGTPAPFSPGVRLFAFDREFAGG
ncbi:MAG TPA: SAM-dependent methyltransferase [Mycobacteriales bacterium]|nr:SAM-dependent methyltransferase [Mycobacteriales bacterium]